MKLALLRHGSFEYWKPCRRVICFAPWWQYILFNLVDIYTSAWVTGASHQLAAHKHKCIRTAYARGILFFMEDPILIMASLCFFCWSIQTGKPSPEESIYHLCIMFTVTLSIKHSWVVSICKKLQKESSPLFLGRLLVEAKWQLSVFVH